MARLATCGFELQDLYAEGCPSFDGVATIDTTTVRTGAASLQIDAESESAGFTIAATSTLFLRFYLRVVSLGAYPTQLMFLYDGSSGLGNVSLDQTGKLELRWGSGGTNVVGSGMTLSTGTWYRVEVRQVIGAGSTDELELRVDGSTVASATGLSIGDTACNFVAFCHYAVSGSGGAHSVRIDDIAVNDSTGSDQNTWPGDGKVYYLRPTGDGTAGTSEANWTKPGGSTTNKYSAVDNAPPTYRADSTNVAQAELLLRNATSAASDLTLTVTDYTTAGVGGSDVVKVVQAVGVFGNSNTTAKGGTIGAPANPTISQLAQTFPTTTASATNTTWKRVAGTISYSPSVTLGTSPQVRVNRSTGTGSALINALAVVVETQPTAGFSDIAAVAGAGAVQAVGSKQVTAAVADALAVAATQVVGVKGATTISAVSNTTSSVQAVGARTILGTAGVTATGTLQAVGVKGGVTTAAVGSIGAVAAVGIAGRAGPAGVTGAGTVTVSAVLGHTPAPTSDLTGWTHVYAEDFDIAEPIGTFPTDSQYGDFQGYEDWTGDTSGHGVYVPSRVLSTHDSMLDIYVHTEVIDDVAYHMTACPYPQDPATHPPETATGRLYGRVSVRYKSDVLPLYKTAWLFWPWSDNWPAEGEIDFPEGPLGGAIQGYMHHPDNSQDTFEDTGYTSDTWHVVTTEWSPGKVEFFVDGVSIGSTTDQTPSAPMYYVLQTETEIVEDPPDDATEGHVLIDWVSIWDYTPPGVSGSASVSGIGSANAVGRKGASVVAAAAGVGSVAAVGAKKTTVVVGVAGSGAAAGNGTKAVSGGASVAGAASAVALGIRGQSGSAAINGTASISVTGFKGGHGATTIAGIGTVTVTGTIATRDGLRLRHNAATIYTRTTTATTTTRTTSMNTHPNTTTTTLNPTLNNAVIDDA